MIIGAIAILSTAYYFWRWTAKITGNNMSTNISYRSLLYVYSNYIIFYKPNLKYEYYLKKKY